MIHPLIVTTTWLKESSDGLGTRNQIFGYLESAEKIGLRQVKQGFSSFLGKSLAKK